MPSERSQQNASYGGAYNTGTGGAGTTPPRTPEQERQDAAAEQERLRQQGAALAKRDLFTANYADADRARNEALGARNEMVSAADMARTAAMGDPNSVAQQQLRGNLQTAQQNQQTAAAATHGGPLAAAAAQRQALVTGGNIRAGGVSQSAGLMANEMASGRDAYGRATSDLRNFDQSMQGQDLRQSMGDRDSAAAQEEQRRAAQRFSEGQATGRGQDELGRQTQQDNLDLEAQKQKSAAENERKGRTAKLVGMGTGVLGAGLSIFSDERGKRPVPLAEAAATMRRR